VIFALKSDHLEELLAAIRARLEACMEYGDAASVVAPTALEQAAELWRAGQLEPESQFEIVYVLAWLHWSRYLVLPEGSDGDDFMAALEFFKIVRQSHPDLVPSDVSGIIGMPQPANEDAVSIYNAGVRLLLEFQQHGQRPAIDQALALLNRGADAVPAGHPRRGYFLSGLGGAYTQRYEAFGDIADLDQAIRWGREAVQAAPADHDDHPDALTNLGMAYQGRYERFGDQADLDEAVRLCTEAARHAGPGHSRRAAILSNAGLTYRAKFDLTDAMADITEAIRCIEDAWQATQADDPGGAATLANLAAVYQVRFTRSGDRADLSKAIEHWQRAERESVGRPDHAIMLSAVGLALRMRSEQDGSDADMDEAIRLSALAVRESSPRHTAYASLLLNCAVTYKMRFDLFLDGADLDEALGYAQRALQATPERHPERAKHLCALAGVHQALFQQTERMDHLDEAIRLGHEGLAATPPTHAERGMGLSDLGLAYRVRFGQKGAAEDLAAAITYGGEAVRATPSGHPERAKRLSNLSLAYQAQYKRTGDEDELCQALRHGRAAVQATPAGHPDRTMFLSNLASAHRAAAGRGNQADLEQALTYWRDAVSSPASPAHQRLRAAVAWGIGCETLDDPAPVAEGFAAAVRLLPLVAWHGLGRGVREQRLADAGGLVADAAGWAIQAGDLENAIELLEQGRSVLWSQALHMRADLTRLSRADEGLESRLDQVRKALDQPRTDLGALAGGDAGAVRDQELVASRHRELARQWDDLVGQVRKLPGLEGFLAATPFSRLRKAASGGPVVMVNISNRRCDALIITAAGVRLRPLPGLTADECSRRASKLLDALDLPAEWDETVQRELIGVVFGTLSWLWDTICEPVVKDLRDHRDLPDEAPAEDGAMPRLWWCPTGPLTLLPLHAAGHYDEPRDACLSGLAVCSYAPTMEALLRSREHPQADADPRVLAVGMPTTPDTGDLRLCDLQNAPKELDLLTEALPGVSVQVLRSPTRAEFNAGTVGRPETQPTRDRVMAALPSHSWVHFACHGGQDLWDPSQGAVYLTDGPLTVLRLAADKLPAAELAFLSACQTAAGGVRLPDEAIHLAAAVQFAGYRHVIATAWSISDFHAPAVTEDVYTTLAASGRLDADRAAVAIHRAVAALRARSPLRPDLWAPYLHIGP
jgi:tetratricopeptide (TPR) repeat protein